MNQREKQAYSSNNIDAMLHDALMKNVGLSKSVLANAPLMQLFSDELKSLFWIEITLLDTLPKLVRHASSIDLKEALSLHIQETMFHATRLEQVFEWVQLKPESVKCKALEGLIKEAFEVVENCEKGVICDAKIIAAVQKIEHFEIAAHGTLLQYAKIMQHKEVIELINSSLIEEQEADLELAEIVLEHINNDASYTTTSLSTFISMKTKSTANTVLICAICLVGTVFITSVGQKSNALNAQTPLELTHVDETDTTERAPIVAAETGDQKFLNAAAGAQLVQIRLGQLAQKKGNSADVKKMGKMMEEDHTKALSQLKTLSKSKSVALPTSTPKSSNDDYNALSKKSGKDFDKTYSKTMVKHHEDAIDLYEKAIEDSNDEEIKAWASKQLTELKAHLTHAKDCQKKVNS